MKKRDVRIYLKRELADNIFPQNKLTLCWGFKKLEITFSRDNNES